MALVFGHETGVLLDARNKPAPAPNNVPLTSHRRQCRGSLVDPYVARASATQSCNFAVRTRRIFRRHYALAPHRPALQRWIQALAGPRLSDILVRMQTALADRYHLEREIGRGGMATVYLARDLKHERPVAIKVLHPELGMALGPERFLREIRYAAQLSILTS